MPETPRLSVAGEPVGFGPSGSGSGGARRGKARDLSALRVIPPAPSRAALPALLTCLADGQEFCLADPLPPQPGTPGFFQCLSSGTSGTRKRIRRSLDSWVASFEVNARQWALGAHDRYAVLGSLSHSLALYALLEGLHLGAEVEVLSDLPARRQWSALQARPPTLLYATPAQLRLLHEVAGGTALPDMRRVAIGGGFLDDAARGRTAELFPAAEISLFYGASETSFITLAGPDSPDGSVGRAYPGAEIRIRSASGTDCEAGVAGEIWVRSPYLFDGYAEGRSAQTRRQDGFLTVGDVGFLDDRGHLHLVGRSDRMFCVADRNLYPEEIEGFLRGQPGVAEAAVLPRDDRKRGTVPVAYLETDLDPAGLEALARTCRRELGPLFAPRRLLPLSDWPRLPSGKTDLQALANRLEREN